MSFIRQLMLLYQRLYKNRREKRRYLWHQSNAFHRPILDELYRLFAQAADSGEIIIHDGIS